MGIKAYFTLLAHGLGLCKLHIVIRHYPKADGPQWIASLFGLSAGGWSDDAAIGTLIQNHKHQLGFKVTLEREKE